MAKYVKCVDNSLYTGCITSGACYKVITQCYDTGAYLIVDDYREERWVPEENFEEPYELPDTITFASQEDFENAVMGVVFKRLGVYNYTESPTGGYSKNYISTEDLG